MRLGAFLIFSVAASAQVLTVDEVVESVRRNHPLLLASLTASDLAEADVLSAEGRFDTTIRSRFDADSFGYYANRRLESLIDQPLSWQGMSLYSGYRLGEGLFAPYDGKLNTRSLGEWQTGLKLPLLRNREIDSRRGELSKARIGRALATHSIDQQRLILTQAGVARYWNWVAAGQRMLISRDALTIAETRQKLLEEGVREGHLPRIDAEDNLRAILQRRSGFIEAERLFQQTAIELSLYLRDAKGQPMQPGLERLPAAFPVEDSTRNADPAAAIAAGLQRRPELKALEAQIEQNGIDVSMARNAAKPALDLVMGFTSDRGTDPAVRRGPEELKVGVAFEFPFQNRSARGKVAATEAKRRQFEQRAVYLRDQVAAEVRDAQSAVDAARNRLRVLEDEVRVTQQLEEAEKERFRLGEGTLFVLNLREQATLDVKIREALARAEYQRSLANLAYATGELLYR